MRDLEKVEEGKVLITLRNEREEKQTNLILGDVTGIFLSLFVTVNHLLELKAERGGGLIAVGKVLSPFPSFRIPLP